MRKNFGLLKIATDRCYTKTKTDVFGAEFFGSVFGVRFLPKFTEVQKLRKVHMQVAAKKAAPTSKQAVARMES